MRCLHKEVGKSISIAVSFEMYIYLRTLKTLHYIDLVFVKWTDYFQQCFMS